MLTRCEVCCQTFSHLLTLVRNGNCFKFVRTKYIPQFKVDNPDNAAAPYVSTWVSESGAKQARETYALPMEWGLELAHVPCPTQNTSHLPPPCLSPPVHCTVWDRSVQPTTLQGLCWVRLSLLAASSPWFTACLFHSGLAQVTSVSPRGQSGLGCMLLFWKYFAR